MLKEYRNMIKELQANEKVLEVENHHESLRIAYQKFIICVFIPALADSFHWKFSDRMYLKNFLGIQADINNAVVWMVSTHHLISKSSIPCTHPSFGDCTKCNNYNWFHISFHGQYFFNFSSKVRVLISLFAFF